MIADRCSKIVGNRFDEIVNKILKKEMKGIVKYVI
jgi:hypothetical protein